MEPLFYMSAGAAARLILAVLIAKRT